MKSAVWRRTTLLLALALVSEVSVYDFDTNYKLPEYVVDGDLPHVVNKEYIRHIHSMFNEYRGERGARLLVQTDALVDTKYRAWKRNADIINSLLALPKGMNDAGR